MKGALQKSKKINFKNLTLTEKPLFRLINEIKIFSFWREAPQTPIATSKCVYFRANMLIWISIGERYSK